MIRVVFLAQLREQLQTAELQIPAGHIENIASLKQHLVMENPHWDAFLNNAKLLVAVNHEYVKGDAAIKPGDEIAFFPPVTGG